MSDPLSRKMRAEFLRLVRDGWDECPSDCEPITVDISHMLLDWPLPSGTPTLVVDNTPASK